MKKMFFTAIALVAFMGTSVASNTKEVKEIEVKKNKTKVVDAACRAAGSSAYASVIACGGSVAQAYDACWNAVYACNHAQ